MEQHTDLNLRSTHPLANHTNRISSNHDEDIVETHDHHDDNDDTPMSVNVDDHGTPVVQSSLIDIITSRVAFNLCYMMYRRGIVPVSDGTTETMPLQDAEEDDDIPPLVDIADDTENHGIITDADYSGYFAVIFGPMWQGISSTLLSLIVGNTTTHVSHENTCRLCKTKKNLFCPCKNALGASPLQHAHHQQQHRP